MANDRDELDWGSIEIGDILLNTKYEELFYIIKRIDSDEGRTYRVHTVYTNLNRIGESRTEIIYLPISSRSFESKQYAYIGNAAHDD